MAPLKIELYRRKYNGADHERNQQATRALFDVMAGGAPLQRKPCAGARNHEEKGHTPGKEEGLNSCNDIALVGIFDVRGHRIEYVGYVEQEDSQY